MDKWIKAGLVMLTVSLVFNLYAAWKVNQLAFYVQQNGNRLDQEVRSGLGSLQALMNDLRRAEEEKGWITRAGVESSKIEGDYVRTRVSWQIREYPEGAPVFFNYRRQGESEYSSVQAESTGGGNFFVDLSLKDIIEPIWNVRMESRGRSGNADQKPARVVAETMGRDSYYNYYITMKDGGITRTTQEENISLAKPEAVYAPLYLNVNVQEDRVYSITLQEEGPARPGAEIAGAYLEVWRGGERLIEKSLQDPPVKVEQRPPHRVLTWDAGDLSYDRLLVRVEYSNGKVFKKEFYPGY